IASTKMQSEWSGLTHFLASVRKGLSDMLQRKELSDIMDGILKQIEDLSTTIFQVQEQRVIDAAADDDDVSSQQQHSLAILTASPSSSSSLMSNIATASLLDGAQQQAPTIFGFHSELPSPAFRMRDDMSIMQIDTKVEPLFRNLEYVYTRLTGPS